MKEVLNYMDTTMEWGNGLPIDAQKINNILEDKIKAQSDEILFIKKQIKLMKEEMSRIVNLINVVAIRNEKQLP